MHTAATPSERLAGGACAWSLAALGTLIPPVPVLAQASDQAAAVRLEGVVVTGSHLRRPDSEGALPVQVITRDEIEKRGETTLEQVLERVPGNMNGVPTALSIGELMQPGFAAVNLRGLGVGSTLVLLNGRRLANYAFNGQTVDLNTIPLAAIARVEVLRDGASAIYGTDAIGGVVNVILRRDFAGTEAAASVDVTQHGGGHAGQASVAYGIGEPARDRYNLFGVFSVQHQQALHGSERESTRTTHRPDLGVSGLSPLSWPANIVDRPRQRLLNPALAAGCAPPSSLPGSVPPLFTPACGFDFAAVADVLPRVDRANAFLRGTWRLSPAFDLHAEGLLARQRVAADIAPFPLPALVTPFGTPTYPAGGRFYPTEFAAANGLTGDLLITWRATELGPRQNTTRGDAQRYVIGTEGQAAGWDLNVGAVHSANRQEQQYGGSYLYQSRIVPALRSGLINPWGPSGPEGRSLLESTAYSGTPQTADGVTLQLQAIASRSVAVLPGGPVRLAIGGERRRERLSYDWDPAVLTGDSPVQLRLSSMAGSRMVSAAFAELGVPLSARLELQLAVRHDDYSDFGANTNPKAALRWQPVAGLLVRGGWSEGFRAPPLYSLNQPDANAGVTGVADPVRCPITGVPDDCFAVIPFSTGGNPGLEPETSRQWSVGAAWEPWRGLSIALDYWNIAQEGVIAELDPSDPDNYVRFPSRVRRGPADAATPGLPGPLAGFDASLINVGLTRTSGLDVEIETRITTGRAGTLRAALQGTYVRAFETMIDGVHFVSRLADATDGAPVPRWRSTLTVDWTRGPLGATVGQSYASGYVERVSGGATGLRKVGAASSWDVQTRWTAPAGWRIAAGVRNFFDEAPPFSLTSTFQFGFNPQVASPLGRTFYLRGAWRFG